MKQIFLKTILIALVVCTFCSCSKKEDDPGNNSRNIKYEITGNFSGKLDVVYTDNVNGNTPLTNVSLPWTKEITYGNNVLTIGIGAQASTTGIAGQSATLKIYSNGVVVKTSTATAGAGGGLILPTIAYQF